ncbi:MAG: hypothetical protein GWN67_18170 [Phycisphaerae bacterium]|nr:hypothetical protein [Phycisphaerae bacterium]NIU58238.1 hypothetical protein [Phycisphaerae bacterium]NIV02028.1 hypothetical protein [Phycisphaerae bacterium]NIV70901.1 hypothetical protein [Phycisphaerae bacterium]
MTVIVITAVLVVAMVIFKDFVNRSGAMRAMDHLRKEIKQYRDEYGSVPPKYWVDSMREKLVGSHRLGNLQYRARWITYESTPDEFLAYTEANYNFLVGKGYIVLRLGAVRKDDGHPEWIDRKKFKTLLAQQQSPEEIQNLQRQR